MAAPKKATHVVVHRHQYLAVAGKLQCLPVGTELTMSDKAAAGLVAKGRLAKIGDSKPVDLTADEPKASIASVE